MSIFHKPISGLITKGLGGPACQMITMKFHLFGCSISVIPVGPQGNVGGGGGGSTYATTSQGFYVPLSKKMNQSTRMVLVTVKMKDKSWRRTYVVSRYKGDIIVKVLGFANTVKSTISVGVESIKRTTKRVSAIFHKADK